MLARASSPKSVQICPWEMAGFPHWLQGLPEWYEKRADGYFCCLCSGWVTQEHLIGKNHQKKVYWFCQDAGIDFQSALVGVRRAAAMQAPPGLSTTATAQDTATHSWAGQGCVPAPPTAAAPTPTTTTTTSRNAAGCDPWAVPGADPWAPGAPPPASPAQGPPRPPTQPGPRPPTQAGPRPPTQAAETTQPAVDAGTRALLEPFMREIQQTLVNMEHRMASLEHRIIVLEASALYWHSHEVAATLSTNADGSARHQ